MADWLLKSELDSYGWAKLDCDGGTERDGIRNAAAAKHMRAMQFGDEAIFYHSGPEKAAVGVVRIARAAQPDGDNGRWVSIRVEPVRPLARSVTLAEMKAAPALANMAMIRQSRPSVSPVTDTEWKTILSLAQR